MKDWNEKTVVEKAIEVAKSLKGVPFRHQGRTRHGLDCIGVVLYSYGAAGWEPHNFGKTFDCHYERVPNAADLEQALLSECIPVDEPYDALPGDILTFSWEGVSEGLPCHVAIISGFNTEVEVEGWCGLPSIIHTHWKVLKVTEHPLDAEWRLRVKGIWRLMTND